jgi:Mor family transcriptional regulator
VSVRTEDDIPAAWRWLLDEQIDIEALPEEVGSMIELIGRKATVKLLAAFSGTQVYFPSLKQAFAKHRAAQIRSAFTGSNHRELAVKFGVSASHVYTLLRDPLPDKK